MHISSNKGDTVLGSRGGHPVPRTLVPSVWVTAIKDSFMESRVPMAQCDRDPVCSHSLPSLTLSPRSSFVPSHHKPRWFATNHLPTRNAGVASEAWWECIRRVTGVTFQGGPVARPWQGEHGEEMVVGGGRVRLHQPRHSGLSTVGEKQSKS